MNVCDKKLLHIRKFKKHVSRNNEFLKCAVITISKQLKKYLCLMLTKMQYLKDFFNQNK